MKKPKHYYCHRNTTQNQNIPQRYQVINKIGQGAFGQVYKVFNSQTSNIEVIKKNKGESTIAMNKQSEIMKQMNDSDGFAKIKDANVSQGFLVMTLLGDSLSTVIQNRSLNLVDMKRIAYQLIQRLKQLHERGFVHRDLKPDNVLLGNQSNPHKIYLVDFGLSSSYKKKAVVARKCYNGEIGTIKFCPLASHNCLQQFPKDDLQSLGYLLIYIVTKSLPWSKLSKSLSEKQQFDQIKRRKESVQIQKLCQGISCLRKYIKIVRLLKVGEQINYTTLLQLFQIKCQDYFCFSFCREQCFARFKDVEEKENDVDQMFQIEGLKHKPKDTIFCINK